MATHETLDELLARNPKVDVHQVNQYLQYLKDLEAVGIDTNSKYQLAHPFSHDPKFAASHSNIQIVSPTT